MKVMVPVLCRVSPEGWRDLSQAQPILTFKTWDERRYFDWVESLPLKERARRFVNMPEYRKAMEK